MESRSQSDDNSMTSLYLKREKGKEDKRVSSSSRVSISKRDLYIVWLRLLRINHVDFSRSGLSISHHHRQRKSILSLSFLFFPTQALFRVDTKRNASVQDSDQGPTLFVHQRIRSEHCDFHHHRPKHRQIFFSTLVRCRWRKKKRKRETQRARARNNKKREIQKKQRERPPEPRKKREKRLYNIITLACGLQKRSHQI